MNSQKKYSLASLASIAGVAEYMAAVEIEKKRKKSLAEKVMKAKGLTREEKQEIYFVLTDGEPPKTKRGRRSSVERDKRLAYAYLMQKYINKWTGISNLVDKYKIPNSDHTTFYKAVNRGINALEVERQEHLEWFEYIIKGNPERANDPKLSEFIKHAKFSLTLIKYHRAIKELEKNQHEINSLE